MKEGTIKKRGQRLLVMLLSVGMLLTYGATSIPSYAADGDDITTGVTLGDSGSEEAKTINVGANAMKICSGGWNKAYGQYLYYGAYNNTPVKYRVLDRHNGTSHTKFNDNTATMRTTGTGDYLLFDSDAILFTSQFGSNNNYSTSTAASTLNDSTKFFSTKEASAIADTSLAASTETYNIGNVTYKDYEASSKSFILSNAEAIQLYDGDNARAKKMVALQILGGSVPRILLILFSPAT